MMRSTRGAARISAVWMICVGVLFLVALAFGFIAQSDLANERSSHEAARTEVTTATERYQVEAEAKRNVSTMLGFYDRESADPVSSVELAEQAMADLRSTFTDLTDADKDLETVLPKLVAAYTARGRKVAELDTRIQGLQSDVQTANGAVSSIQQEKDKLIAGLRQQIADEQQNAAQRESELQARLDTSLEQVSERDAAARQARSDADEERRNFEQERRLAETRLSNLAQATAFTRDEFKDAPDGKIISVSNALNTAWIDLGTRNRLARGMRFRVESGNLSSRKYKAMAQVIEVDVTSAQVVLEDMQDEFDKVVEGDVVVNPLYDPTGERNAVLAGRFSLYSEEELKVLLGRIGINLQPKLDATTHFLIVGSEVYTDPETGEPLDEPIQPSELKVYQDAVGMGGVVIVPIQNLRAFFAI